MGPPHPPGLSNSPVHPKGDLLQHLDSDSRENMDAILSSSLKGQCQASLALCHLLPCSLLSRTSVGSGTGNSGSKDLANRETSATKEHSDWDQRAASSWGLLLKVLPSQQEAGAGVTCVPLPGVSCEAERHFARWSIIQWILTHHSKRSLHSIPFSPLKILPNCCDRMRQSKKVQPKKQKKR